MVSAGIPIDFDNFIMKGERTSCSPFFHARIWDHKDSQKTQKNIAANFAARKAKTTKREKGNGEQFAPCARHTPLVFLFAFFVFFAAKTAFSLSALLSAERRSHRHLVTALKLGH
jgi:hypothetical protein